MIEWGDPKTLRALVLKVATPAARMPVPMVVRPSKKSTVPVGVPAPGGTAATVAVNVTVWPKTLGLTEEVRVAVVSAGLTTWERTAEVLVAKLVSPE